MLWGALENRFGFRRAVNLNFYKNIKYVIISVSDGGGFMATDLKTEFFKKFVRNNRIVYGLLMFIAMFVRGSGVTKSTFVLVYYVAAGLLMLIIDELLFSNIIKRIEQNKAKIPSFIIKIRTILYALLLSVGSIFSEVPGVLLVSVFFICFYVILQDMLFSDIFNTFSNEIRLLFSMGIATFILFFIHYRHKVDGGWFIIFAFGMGIVLFVVHIVYDAYYSTVKDLDDQYTKLFFKNTDLMAENEKLVEFREKVEKVNSEINYQKINLTKANSDLENTNIESRSLIEVMKYFSASFDVQKNVHIMIENIMNVKKAGAVGFYIDKDVYMNDDPCVDVISVNDVMGTMIKQDILNIYNMIKNRNSTEPVVLCDNYDFKYPFLSGGNICNAVAFPAYENENVYGVMVVSSSKYEFFQNGHSFYESSVMDFTSALISDRLYLKTEEMAKKDGLTKIYNRIYYNQFYPELMDEVLATGEKLTVAMMDIDHFKSVNDTYGHLAGDEVIKMVAGVDAKYAKKYNGKAVRFGGEEFLLILKGIGVDEAYSILDDMHKEIVANVVEFEDLKIQVNVSMGLASYPETCEDIGEVVDKSDQALYYSKEHGRGRITIDGREEE